MEKLEYYRWVDNDVNIDDFYDNLPPIVKDIVDRLEKADLEEHYGYFELCEALENVAKQFVPDGTITRKQWELLCSRYWGG